MNLGHLVATENGLADEQVLLLRHSNANLRTLLNHGASIEEYTLIQPTESKYDFLADGKPKIRAVVAIAFDRVHAVYMITGVQRAGTTHSLGSPAFTAFDIARGFAPRPAKRFAAAMAPSRSVSCAISGWTSPRNAVARSSGKLFQTVEVRPG